MLMYGAPLGLLQLRTHAVIGKYACLCQTDFFVSNRIYFGTIGFFLRKADLKQWHFRFFHGKWIYSGAIGFILRNEDFFSDKRTGKIVISILFVSNRFYSGTIGFIFRK